MANSYDIGDVSRIYNTFSQSGVVITPTTVALVVKAPDGTSTSYTYAGGTVLRDADGTHTPAATTGTFYVDVAVALAGTYRYRWTSTGTGAASEEGWFEVRPRRVS